MEDKYYSSGRTIKNFCALYVMIVFVASAILGVMIGQDDETLGWIIFLVGTVSAAISVLFTYAFGEMVESCACTAHYIEQIADVVELQRLQAKREEKTKRSLTGRESVLAEGDWKCVCGRINASYVSTCVCKRNRREGDTEINQKQSTQNILNTEKSSYTANVVSKLTECKTFAQAYEWCVAKGFDKMETMQGVTKKLQDLVQTERLYGSMPESVKKYVDALETILKS